MANFRSRSRKVPLYRPPAKQVHRGFVYLDDETVINSLSAVESGKIDEVVAKVNSAREGGIGAGLTTPGAKMDASKKETSALAEEMVRTRTRFSVFELWYRGLVDSKAIGFFHGWGTDALADVKPGETIEFRANLETAPIQTLFRTYLWFAEKAKSQGHIFSQSGETLKSTKDAERNIRMLLGEDKDDFEEVILLAIPVGDPGPKVAMPTKMRWLIGDLGRLGGEYTVVAQVERVLGPTDELPALRLTREVAATPVEVDSLKQALSGFVEPAKAMGIEISDNEATIDGPALWLDPIAIYR